jgi:hypothetical protein
VDPISVVSGLVQTGLYLDFFYSEWQLREGGEHASGCATMTRSLGAHG